jgi:uroporphyrinogen decarboxylase
VRWCWRTVNLIRKRIAEVIHKVLAHITETLRSHVDELVDAGASGLFYAALQWTSLDVCDDAFYSEFGRPYDLKVLSAADNALFNIFHVCGNNIGLDRFLDYPNAVFNWNNFGPGNDSLAQASRKTSKIVAAGIPQ